MILLSNDDFFDRRLREFLADRAEEYATASASQEEMVERLLARSAARSSLMPRLPATVRWALILALLVAVAVVALLVVGGRGPVPLPRNGPLAYAMGQQLFVVQPDGSPKAIGSAAAPDADGFCCFVSWSPAGDRILTWSGQQAVVVSADGATRVELLPGEEIGAGAAWSPSGREIAMPTLVGNGNQVIVVAADGTARRQVSNDVAFTRWPAWSPDGEWIAFGAPLDRSATREGLFVVRPDGRDQRLVAALEQGFDAGWGTPIWTADGSRILVAMRKTYEELRMRLVSVGVADGTIRQLASRDLLGRPPAWSPDGSLVALTVFRADADIADLWVGRTDLSDLHVLQADVHPEAFSWSPDGTRLVFAYRNGGAFLIGRARPDGSDRQDIRDAETGGLSWGALP
jgi:Tol biopolymer transport system component